MSITKKYCVSDAWGYKEASRLYDILMNQQGYNRILRPVVHANDTLTVFFGLGLLQLMDLVSLNALPEPLEIKILNLIRFLRTKLTRF